MRPTEPCGQCKRLGVPGCTHLGEMHDYATKVQGHDEQSLIVYALNRMLALSRDNKHKAEGVLPERRYVSNLQRAEERAAKAKARRAK